MIAPRAFAGGLGGDTRGVCSDTSSECANTGRIREPGEPSMHTTRHAVTDLWGTSVHTTRHVVTDPWGTAKRPQDSGSR